MPVHDWTRVSAGTFHHFHHEWIATLARALNDRLPEDFYALAEQGAGATVPDVLTLENVAAPLAEQGYPLHPESSARSDRPAHGGVALAEAPPKVSLTDVISEAALLTLKQKHIAIRHATDDRIVALVEIVSPGNKDGRGPIGAFVDKAHAALQHGYHLMVVDVLPPGPAAAGSSLHDRIWRPLGGQPHMPAPEKPLTLASYRVAKDVTAYVEALAVGEALPDMPLFFTPDRYVNAPLDATYAAAYEGVPRRWRAVIEGAPQR